MAEKSDLKRAAKVLKAIGNGHRLHILQLLAPGERNVSEINKDIRISQPSLSQHLARLKREGVLNARRDQRQIYYSIGNPHVLHLLTIIADIAHTGGSSRRRSASMETAPSFASQFAEMA